jgi:hypothetical protein
LSIRQKPFDRVSFDQPSVKNKFVREMRGKKSFFILFYHFWPASAHFAIFVESALNKITVSEWHPIKGALSVVAGQGSTLYNDISKRFAELCAANKVAKVFFFAKK